MRRLLRLPLSAAFARAGRWVVGALAALALCGCRSLPLQPPIDLSGPGWVVREGQGIWRPRSGAEGVAGDLVVATHADGRSVVQFTKTPLPFLVAQRTPQGWQAEFIPRNKTYSGRGEPPARLLWLHLPEALVNGKAPEGFRFTTDATGSWRFERQATGESLEGYLEPVSSTNKLPSRTTGGAQLRGALPKSAVVGRAAPRTPSPELEKDCPSLKIGRPARAERRALPLLQARRPSPYGVSALAGRATDGLRAGLRQTPDQLKRKPGLRA